MLVEGNGEEETPVLSCRSHPQRMRDQLLAVTFGKSTHLFVPQPPIQWLKPNGIYHSYTIRSHVKIGITNFKVSHINRY